MRPLSTNETPAQIKTRVADGPPYGIASAHLTCLKPSSVAIAHLLDTDDHAETMAALEALGTPTHGGNVIPLHG